MSETAKKFNYLADFLHYQSVYCSSIESKKETTSFFKDSFLDPFSKNGLLLHQFINTYMIRFEKEIFQLGEEEKIFQILTEDFNQLNLGSLSHLKKSWQSVLVKRRILPKSCFIDGIFNPNTYKKILFSDLEQRVSKTQTSLSLCYHFGSEFQETCAILNGQFIDLEEITLEFVCFIEHQIGNFKHAGLFIQDSMVIQASILLLLKNTRIGEEDHKNILRNLIEKARKIDLDSFLLQIFNYIKIEQEITPSISLLLNKFDPKEQLSFLYHLENLLKIFQTSETKILKLCSDYMESIEKKELFFEKDYIPEVPLLIDLLLLLNNEEISFVKQKTQILNFFSYVIKQTQENPRFILNLLSNSHKNNQVDIDFFIQIFNLSDTPSIKEINDIFLVIQGVKKLGEKKDYLKLTSVLSKERFLAISRISQDSIRFSEIKTLKEIELTASNPLKKVSIILNNLKFSSSEIEEHIRLFYPIF